MMVPILISAVVSFVVGYLWYGPLFGKTWMRLAHIPEPVPGTKPEGMMWKMFTHLVLCVLTTTSLTLLVLIPGLVIPTYALTFIAWLGFIFPQHMSDFLWQGKSFKLVAFENVAILVTLALAINILFYVR
jgi:hypothetical protein